jgi:dipeptidyl aminopeptidase/acylaminoacyl peptidase
MLRWLLLLLVSAAFAADAPVTWTPELSMQVQAVDDVTPSPDGKLVLWTQKRAVMDPEHSEFVTHIFLAHADGSGRTQLTRGEKSSTSPQFSPDGRFVYFISDRVAGKKNLFRISVAGGEAEILTEWKGALGVYKISPDGRRVAFTATEEDKDAERRKKEKNDYKVIDEDKHNQALYVKPVDTETPVRARQLVDNKQHVAWFDWSPDGQRIVYEHHPTASQDDARHAAISEVETTGGAAIALAPGKGSASHPLYSPDGRYIAFTRGAGKRDEVEGTRIVLLTRSDGAVRELPSTFDEQPDVAGWTPDSKSILYQEFKGVRTVLYAMPIDGAPSEFWSPKHGTIGRAHLSEQGTHIGFAMQTTDDPIEAYVAPAAGGHSGQAVRVSAANSGLPKPPLGKTELIRWKSKDGLEIEGLLTTPVGYQAGTRVPLILNVHGGPSAAFGESFLGSSGPYPLAAWSAKGFAVLRANPRGSTAYGREFRRGAVEDWGGMAFQDLMAGVDHVIGMGVADPDKLAIMGWSYGGYMTAWAITQTTRFKAAAIGAGITNTVSMYGTQDIPSIFEDYFGGTPWEKPAIYAKNSPIEFITRVKTPTLIQHGEADPRVPVSQGYEYYRALKKLSVPVKMVVYPRMPHGPNEPKFTLQIMQEHLQWAEKYLR